MKRSTIFIFFLLIAAPLFGQNAPEKYGWSFRNYGTAVYNWDVFRNSMFAIPQDSSGVTAPFDWLFYDLCFKTKLGAGGNCYGLSLLSAVMNNDGGHLGYCCPTNFYGGVSLVGPTDPKLNRAINIMHGHQVSLACLQVFLDQFFNGHSQDATFAVALAQTALEREGIFLVSITKNLSPSDGGHTLLAYKMTHLGGSHYRIFLVDVNRIWADSTTPDNRDFYVAGNNFIDCNGPNWTYNMGGSLGIWPAGPHGHLTVLPVSVASPTGRVPSSLGLAVGELLNKIFIAHDGEGATINQIRNGEGKRMFIPSTKEVDWDTKTGIRKIMPWFPSGALPDAKPYQFETYFHFGALQNAEVDFTSGTKGARVAIGDNTGYALVNCKEDGATATVAVSGLGTANPHVIIKNASKPITCDIDILIPTKRGEINKVFSLKEVEVLPGKNSELECGVANARDITLKGNSQKGALLTITQQSVDESKQFTTEAISITPSNNEIWSQEQWELMKKNPVQHLTGK